MNKQILDFCNQYEKKLVNDKDIKDNPESNLSDFRDRIKFRINVHSSAPGYVRQGGYFGETLFELDEEDLKYLYDKYSKMLEKEMQDNIQAVKDQYLKKEDK